LDSVLLECRDCWGGPAGADAHRRFSIVTRRYGKPQRETWTFPQFVQLQERLALPAVPARRAAEILGVNRRSIYRYLESGALELVPRQGGKAWISIRTIAEFMKNHYSPTDKFDVLLQIDPETAKK
jgi:hypothetical protein